MTYKVEQPLRIPEHLYKMPIEPDTLRDFGLDPSMPQSLLAQIELRAVRKTPRDVVWHAEARSMGEQMERLGSITCKHHPDRTTVLQEVYAWVQSSKAVECVPAIYGDYLEDIIEDHHIAEIAVQALILVRDRTSAFERGINLETR